MGEGRAKEKGEEDVSERAADARRREEQEAESSKTSGGTVRRGGAPSYINQETHPLIKAPATRAPRNDGLRRENVTSEQLGSPVPEITTTSDGLVAHAGDFEKTWQGIFFKSSLPSLGGYTRRVRSRAPPKKKGPSEKPKVTMFGHQWKRLRTNACRATSSGSGATDVGPT